MITSALHLSRMGALKTEKKTQHQLYLSKLAWDYSPGGMGTSGLISQLPEVMDSSNKGGHSAALGPATGGLGLGASATPGEGLGTCITL